MSVAVSVSADHHRFPKTWLFEHRWGGTRGSAQMGVDAIVRDAQHHSFLATYQFYSHLFCAAVFCDIAQALLGNPK